MIDDRERKRRLKVIQKRRLAQIERTIDKTLEARKCDGCTGCCTPLAIASLEKPRGVPCVHLGEGCCSIYPDRPEECRSYVCMWKAGVGDMNDRPDKTGVMFTPSTAESPLHPILIAHETRPGAFEESADFITRIARNFLLVLMRDGGPRSVLGPEERMLKVLPIVERLKKEMSEQHGQ